MATYGYNYGYGTEYEQPSYSTYEPDPYAGYGQQYSTYEQPSYDSYDPYGYDPGYTYDQQPAYEPAYEQPAYEYQAPPAPTYEEQAPAYQAQQTTPTYQPDYSDPYANRDAYSTGAYAPEDVWAEPEQRVSDPSTGRYDASQYIMENTYSTGEYAPADVWREPVTLPVVDQTGRVATSPPPETITPEYVPQTEPAVGPVNTDPLSAGMRGPEGGEMVLPDYGPSIPDQIGGWFGDRGNDLGVYTDTLGTNVQQEITDLGSRRNVLTDQLAAEASEYLVSEPEALEAVQAAAEGDFIGLDDGQITGYVPEAIQAADVAITDQAIKPAFDAFTETVLPELGERWAEVPDPIRVGGEFLGEKALQAATLAGDWNESRVGEQIYQYHTTGAEPTTPYTPGLITDVGINKYDPEEIKQVYEQGYNGLTGGQAVFTYVNDQEHPGGIVGTGVRAAYDPVTALTLAIPGLNAAKGGTSALRAANPASKSARLLDATVGGVARGAEVIDAATSLPFSLPGMGRNAAGRLTVGRTAADEATTIPINPGAATWPTSIDQQFPEWAGTTRPPASEPVGPAMRAAAELDEAAFAAEVTGALDPATIAVREGQNAATWRPEYSVGTWDPITVTQTPDNQWMITENWGGRKQHVATLPERDEAIRQAQVRMAQRTAPPADVTGGVSGPPAPVPVPITTRPAAAGVNQPVAGGTPILDRNGVPLRTREAIDATQQQPSGGLTPEQAEAQILGPDGNLLPTTQRTVTPTGEPVVDPALARTPGIEGDVPAGDRLRRIVQGGEPIPIRPGQQLTPPDSEGITAPLREQADELRRLRVAAETNQPVDLPAAPQPPPGQLDPNEAVVPQELVDASANWEGSVLSRDLRETLDAVDAQRTTEASLRGRLQASQTWLDATEQSVADFTARHGDTPSDPRTRRQLDQLIQQRDAMRQQRDDAARQLETLSPDAQAAPTTGATTPEGLARQTAPSGASQVTETPARTPEMQQAPTRTNSRGESLSDATWTPPDVRVRADEAVRSRLEQGESIRNIPIRVKAGQGIDKWTVDGKHPYAPESIAMRDRMLAEMQSPTMTTQRFDTAEARSWRALMFESESPSGGRILEATPSQNQGYRTWLETVAPLVKKEPAMWNGRQGQYKGIFARDKTNRHAIADARKVAAGTPVDQVIRERFPNGPGKSSTLGIIPFDPETAAAEWHEATRLLRESGVPTIAGRQGRETDEQNVEGVQALEATIRTILEQAAEVPGEFMADPKGTIGAGLSNIGKGVRAPIQQVNQGIGRWTYEQALQAAADPNFRSASDLVNEHGGLIRLIHERGFVPSSGEYAGQRISGDRAVWEFMILQQPMWVQFAAEVILDPLNVTGIFGKLAKAEKAPDLVKGIGTLLGAPDAAFNLATDAVLGAGSQLKHVGRIPIVGTPFNWLFSYSKETRAAQQTARFIDAANETINAAKAPFGAPISSDAAKATLTTTFTDPKHPLVGKTWGDALTQFTADAKAVQTEYAALKAAAKPTPKQAARIKAIDEEWGSFGADILTADPGDLGAARTALEVSLDQGITRGKPRGIVDILANGLVSDGVLHTPMGVHWGYSLRNLVGNPSKAIVQGDNPLPFFDIFKVGNFRKAIGGADATHPAGQIGDLSFVETARKAGIGVPIRINRASSLEQTGMSTGFTQLMQRLGAGKLVQPGGQARKFAPTTHAKALDEGMEAAQKGLVWEKKFQQETARAANTRNTFIDETLRRTPRLRIPADALESAKRAIPNGASGSDVAVAMRDLALKNGATPALADDFAKKVGQRQANLIQQASATAVRNTENVFVAFDPRNIDKVVGFGTNFHYWPSRAAMDVGEAAMRSPRIISNYLAAKDGIGQLAQSDDPRVQGLVRVGQTIGGLATFANPLLALPMGFLMRQAGDEMVPMGETTVGAWMREAEKFGVRGNWIVDGFANLMGLQGDTFAPTFIPRKDLTMLEAAANFVLTQMGAEPIPRIVDQRTGEMREGVTTWLNERGFPVSVLEAGDANGFYEDKIASLIREMHPELTDEEWDAAVTAGPGNPLWDEAARHQATMDVVTTASRSYTPVSLSTRNEGRDSDIRQAKEGRDAIAAAALPEDATPEERMAAATPEQQQAIKNRNIATNSPESKEWRAKTEEYHSLGTEQQQFLGKAFNAIKYASEDMARPITVDGETYTRERLAAMEPKERSAIAYAWLETQPGDAAAQYDDLQQKRAEYRNQNPGVQGLDDMARDYPGGRDALITDLRGRSPRYDAYIGSLSETPQSEEWYKDALGSSGYANAVGNEWSVYDKDLPGDPTIAREVAQYEADRQAEFEAQQAEYEQYAEDERFGVTEQVRSFTNYVGERVEFIESWGMSPEDTQYVKDLYLASAYGLTDEKLPYEIWDPLRDQFGSDYVYPKFFDNEYKAKARGYLQAKAQNPSITLEDFLVGYKKERKAERDAFDVNRDVYVPGR